VAQLPVPTRNGIDRLVDPAASKNESAPLRMLRCRLAGRLVKRNLEAPMNVGRWCHYDNCCIDAAAAGTDKRNISTVHPSAVCLSQLAQITTEAQIFDKTVVFVLNRLSIPFCGR